MYHGNSVLLLCTIIGSNDDTHNGSGNGAGETSERDASSINTALSQGMCDCNCVV